jgi:hypothetical protein
MCPIPMKVGTSCAYVFQKKRPLYFLLFTILFYLFDLKNKGSQELKIKNLKIEFVKRLIPFVLKKTYMVNDY